MSTTLSTSTVLLSVEGRSTAVSLRDELEQLRFDKDAEVQTTVALSTDEIGQLKATATALRDELDRIKVTYEERIQDMERAARDEAAHLQETINVLRRDLETRDGK